MECLWSDCSARQEAEHIVVVLALSRTLSEDCPEQQLVLGLQPLPRVQDRKPQSCRRGGQAEASQHGVRKLLQACCLLVAAL